jgi:hypothetical protein
LNSRQCLPWKRVRETQFSKKVGTRLPEPPAAYPPSPWPRGSGITQRGFSLSRPPGCWTQ